MILCVSPNTGIERTWKIPGFVKGGVFRVAEETVLPSGKGINVARAVQTLGEPVRATGFTAGIQGRYFSSLAKDAGLAGSWVWVAGETRTAVAIYDPEGPTDATLLSAAGPNVSERDWRRLETRIRALSRSADLVSFSGSLPPGSPLGLFTNIIAELEARGKQVWVDCDGGALEAALAARPNGVKINATEASSLTGIPVQDYATALQAAEILRRKGARQVVLTLGRQGVIMQTETECWRAAPPETQPFVSSVGSGDSFMAGLLVGLERKWPTSDCLRSACAAGAANTLAPGGARFTFQDYQTILEQTTAQLFN
ncbi:MAG: hexose kinase [Chloroflexi bacterium]|nr:hexose kinase [Chloroflexota bacterium]